MQIIVTPTNGKLACIIDTISGEVIREIDIPPELQVPKNRPYGITKDFGGNWYISNWNKIGVFDPDFNFSYAINHMPENIHQIHYDDASDELWVCATSIDSLLAINIKQATVRRFSLTTNQWVGIQEPGSDTQHFSSVHWYGSYLYVLAHKFGKENSCLNIYDRAMIPVGRWSAGWEAHSICRFNDQVFIVDSRGGRVLGTNGVGMSLGSAEMFNSVRNQNYDNGEISINKYARGMCLNDCGIGVTAIFDFGNASTRTNGSVNFLYFSIPDREIIRQFCVHNLGNIQDIQIYKEEPTVIHQDVSKYQCVIDELNKLIPSILEEKYYDTEDRMPYDPNRHKPNFDTRLDVLSGEPIDYAAQKNLKKLTKGIEAEAERLLNEIMPQ